MPRWNFYISQYNEGLTHSVHIVYHYIQRLLLTRTQHNETVIGIQF